MRCIETLQPYGSNVAFMTIQLIQLAIVISTVCKFQFNNIEPNKAILIKKSINIPRNEARIWTAFDPKRIPVNEPTWKIHLCTSAPTHIGHNPD